MLRPRKDCCMSKVNPHRRLWGENFTLIIPMGERHHEVTLHIARDEHDVPRTQPWHHVLPAKPIKPAILNPEEER